MIESGKEQKNALDVEHLQDFVCSHGYGEATNEGIQLGEQLIATGDDLATAAAEIVARGLTENPDGEEEE